MKIFSAIILILLSLSGYSQVDSKAGEVFIGLKRNHLQTVLRDYHVQEYEKGYAGFKVNESAFLYTFFDDDQVCNKFYWMVDAPIAPAFKDTLVKKGWEAKKENLLQKEGYTCEISLFNEGKNLIFMFEGIPSHNPPLAEASEVAKPREQPKTVEKPKEKPQEKSVSNEALKQKKETGEEPKFQGLKIWGIEVLKF